MRYHMPCNLDRVFPNLQSCDISSDEDTDGWCDAQEVIRMLQRARQDAVLRINLGVGTKGVELL